MERPRRISRAVHVGPVQIGGGAPISVQSMTTGKTHDVEKCVAEITRLAEAGADVVRIAVPRPEDADALAEVADGSPVPVVADIHFNYKYALKAIESGVAKVRINPGNIGKAEWEREVLLAAKEKGVPIRIGVNSGSLEKDILDKYGYPQPEALFESAMRHVEVCERVGFEDLVISVKHSDVFFMIQSYRLLAERTDYPLHLGVTESGSLESGTIKSSIGIGSLLADGIGDTIRVSLSADSIHEVKVGHRILKSLRLGRPGVNIIACPTCGRLAGDLISIVEEVEAAVEKANFEKDLNVALMGCAVNGPGEAAGADLGVSLGRGRAHLFKHGEIIRTVPEDTIVEAVLETIAAWDDDPEPEEEAPAPAAEEPKHGMAAKLPGSKPKKPPTPKNETPGPAAQKARVPTRPPGAKPKKAAKPAAEKPKRSAPARPPGAKPKKAPAPAGAKPNGVPARPPGLKPKKVPAPVAKKAKKPAGSKPARPARLEVET